MTQQDARVGQWPTSDLEQVMMLTGCPDQLATVEDELHRRGRIEDWEYRIICGRRAASRPQGIQTSKEEK
jgi:hypothetical protein